MCSTSERKGKLQLRRPKNPKRISKFRKSLNFCFGCAVFINFMIFWALPIGLQGQGFKLLFRFFMQPIFAVLDTNEYIRKIGLKVFYSRPRWTDYFVTSVLQWLWFGGMLFFAFKWQHEFGYLPWWAIVIYNFAWVGPGGRAMGAAYATAHREGHSPLMYQHWLRKWFGNPFENIMGLMYGNVPYNFTTSHIQIHHRLNGGIGDTFYQWDLDRSSLHDLMLYLSRITAHTSGFSSLNYFSLDERRFAKHTRLLKRGMFIYWIVVPAILFAITRSVSFVVWVHLQPFLSMTFFLAFMNFGFHYGLAFNEFGEHITCVDATAICDDPDDYYGESDHLQHHYHPSVYWADFAENRKKLTQEFAKHHASVFKHTSIVEMSAYLLGKDWSWLADHFVDYSGKLTKQEIMDLIKERAQRVEISYDEYEGNLTHWRQLSVHKDVWERVVE